MALRIEDYAVIGDLRTAALVGSDGSIDWLCVPSFDAAACFAALLGTPEHGRWRLAPAGDVRAVERRYRGDSVILETTFTCAGGSVRVIDFMPVGSPAPTIVRIAEGIEGRVELTSELVVRFSYGEMEPWITRIEDGCTLVAVGDALAFRADRPLATGHRDPHVRFALERGERAAFTLSWYPSYAPPPPPHPAQELLHQTQRWWERWAVNLCYDGPDAAVVRRSATILKALFSEPYGASIAAVTTSLPEQPGGDKNWDYRFAWVRDSCFTIDALLHVGLHEEAVRWRDWVLRALAGRPERLQIMYGVSGGRILTETNIASLPGYEDSRPVRIGNAAHAQFQLGIYGEAMGAMYAAHARGIPLDESDWEMLRALVTHVEGVWEQPDSGIWESRGEPRHHTHSKVEAWRALACAVKMVREYGYPGDADRWSAVAQRIHRQICERAFDPDLGAFVQSYGSRELDASVLLMPLLDFLPPDDPRVRGTLRAIESRLLEDGFVYRCSNDPATSAGAANRSEGAFLACNFWLVENYVQQGRLADARALFDRVCGVAGDLGILSEEYLPRAGRLIGNVPQTFSHAALINAAVRLREASGSVSPSVARAR